MSGPTGPRNGYGVKSSADCWRTIGGIRWRQWMCDPPEAFVRACRGWGVRFRHVKHSDGSRDLFVHPQDEAVAEHVRSFVCPML